MDKLSAQRDDVTISLIDQLIVRQGGVLHVLRFSSFPSPAEHYGPADTGFRKCGAQSRLLRVNSRPPWSEI